MAVKILIADDHKIMRVGIRGILEREPGLVVVADAGSGEETCQMIDRHQPDVILMDIDMGASSGIDLTWWVKARYPGIQVLGLTMHDEETHIVQMLEAGASGYLLKTAGPEEIIAAIRAVARGDSYFSQSVSATLLKALTLRNDPEQRKKKPDSGSHQLSDREVEVLKLICDEYSNLEIAEKLFISVRTVDSHRRNVMEKLQVKNTAGLVRYAIEKGLL